VARRIKGILESRTDRLDVHVCEEIQAGDDWKEWIEDSISQSKMLLVLWPQEEMGTDPTWIEREIDRFRSTCPKRRIAVLKAVSDPVPYIAKDLQIIDVSRDRLTDLMERLLQPLYWDRSFLDLETPLNERVTRDDIKRDAREILRLFIGATAAQGGRRARRRAYHRSYCELLVVETDHNATEDMDSAVVRAPNGCVQILNWTRQDFSWKELRARAAEEADKGTFWVTEMERVIQNVAQRNTPRVMTSTFRGREQTAGRIYQPQLERVDFLDDTPIRYFFSFHEVLVPELVRGPGELGDVFNLLHVAARVRWEVLNPFLVNRVLRDGASSHEQKRRDSLIAKVSGSLRAIELEASRHNMLQEEAITTFRGEDRDRIVRMLGERESIKLAIGKAVEQNDFDGLIEELTRALQLNCSVIELLTEKFLQLIRKDNKEMERMIEGDTGAMGMPPNATQQMDIAAALAAGEP